MLLIYCLNRAKLRKAAKIFLKVISHDLMSIMLFFKKKINKELDISLLILLIITLGLHEGNVNPSSLLVI